MRLVCGAERVGALDWHASSPVLVPSTDAIRAGTEKSKEAFEGFDTDCQIAVTENFCYIAHWT